MAVDRFISKNNPISLSPCFTFIPKTDVGLREPGVRFYGVPTKLEIYKLEGGGIR